MAAPEDPRPLRILIRNLIGVLILAIAIYLVFAVYNKEALGSFTATEVLLIEAVAVVLLAFAVAEAFTNATNALLRRHGQLQHGAAVRIFVNLLVAIAAVLALFHLAGVSAESIFLGSAFAGIVLGLAAQTVLGNVFAGLLLVVASPFHPGDRLNVISWQYGAFPPSYPHEMIYPNYTGTVEDVELLYTILRLDSGGLAKVPNAIVLQALIVLPKPGVPKSHRVRMTFPLTVPVATVEAALAGIASEFPSDAARTPPRFEVTDIGATTWDGVVVVWTTILDESVVRDRTMRAVLARLPAAARPK
jgi:small-conductance mechanosensitive channel